MASAASGVSASSTTNAAATLGCTAQPASVCRNNAKLWGVSPPAASVCATGTTPSNVVPANDLRLNAAHTVRSRLEECDDRPITMMKLRVPTPRGAGRWNPSKNNCSSGGHSGTCVPGSYLDSSNSHGRMRSRKLPV